MDYGRAAVGLQTIMVNFGCAYPYAYEYAYADAVADADAVSDADARHFYFQS